VGVATVVGIDVAVLATGTVAVGAEVGAADGEVPGDVPVAVVVATAPAVGVGALLRSLLEPHAASVPSSVTEASRLALMRIWPFTSTHHPSLLNALPTQKDDT
jgi:hypothetical protein